MHKNAGNVLLAMKLFGESDQSRTLNSMRAKQKVQNNIIYSSPKDSIDDRLV